MTGGAPGQEDERVLVLAPTPKDASMTQSILSSVGLACTTCSTVEVLCRELLAGGAGAVLLTEHACWVEEIRHFTDYLAQQPPWSDLPVVILANGGANSIAGRRAMELFGSGTVLERPVQTASLASVVRTLIRSRRRQYQIREHLRERERAEAERERLLESERAARNEAERVSHVKDEFLATLSHELRTPLNAILGWSTILRGGSLEEDDLSQGLETIERNARAQAQIIEDLLDMSRIVSGKIRLDVQRVSLPSIIEAAIDTVRPAIVAKEIQLQKMFDPRAGIVSGDPNRLQQVLWNLLSNAVKFTPRGGTVRVLLERPDSLLKISVTDTGEGINPEFLPHVFDRFRQEDASTARRHGGLGLGLAIVKQLVEVHGGTIAANSEGAGRGSTFTVMLPLPTAQEDAPAQPDRRSPRAPALLDGLGDGCTTLNGLKVLVVDDEPDARLLLKRLLEECEAVVSTADSCANALAAFQRDQPDLLISDIGMPGEDGYTLIRTIRALDKSMGGETPALALTAYARSEDRSKAIQCGFQKHLSKPVEPAELMATVASLAGWPTETAGAAERT